MSNESHRSLVSSFCNTPVWQGVLSVLKLADHLVKPLWQLDGATQLGLANGEWAEVIRIISRPSLKPSAQSTMLSSLPTAASCLRWRGQKLGGA